MEQEFSLQISFLKQVLRGGLYHFTNLLTINEVSFNNGAALY